MGRGTPPRVRLYKRVQLSYATSLNLFAYDQPDKKDYSAEIKYQADHFRGKKISPRGYTIVLLKGQRKNYQLTTNKYRSLEEKTKTKYLRTTDLNFTYFPKIQREDSKSWNVQGEYNWHSK